MKNVTARYVRNLPFGSLARVRKFGAAPGPTQQRVLQKLIATAATTTWGVQHGYGNLSRASNIVKDYQARVSLSNYEDMREPVAQMRRGTENVLWPGKPRYFAASSGTTSEGRVIPVSSAMLRSNRAFSLAVFLNHLANTRRAGLLTGKHLSLPGWIEDDDVRLGTRIGQISAILAESSGRFTRPWRAIGNRHSFVSDWEEKMAAIATHTMNQDIRLIVIAPSWCQVLFKMVEEQYRKKEGADARIGEIWPNLTTIITGGVALSGYRDLLTDYIGHEGVDFVETYGASEGFLAFQDDLHDPAMLLHLDNGIFMEFVPLDELHSESPTRCTIDDVRTGVKYALHVSTNSGFWSYELGDIVQFTSTEPHKIKVVGRTTEMLDKYGEAVFGDEARKALLKAAEDVGARVLEVHITHTRLGPSGIPAHHWLVEFDRAPDAPEHFAAALDTQLKAAGHHYHDRREGHAFGPPTVTILKPGTFYSWLASTGKRLSVQTKVPTMHEEHQMADQIIAFAESEGRIIR